MNRSFPAGFLWGAATAAHQTEGNNTTSDLWPLEYAADSPFQEPSGDACDSLHRWGEDLDIVRDLGLNAYRFSLEWARIEPVRGVVSRAMLGHYRSIAEGCLERGITPVVTLNHFTVPLWFAKSGGWLSSEAPTDFARFVRSVLPVLDGVEWVCTLNEPNIVAITSALRAHKMTLEMLTSLDDVPVLPPELLASVANVARAIPKAHEAAQEVLGNLSAVRSGWTVAHLLFEGVEGAQERADALNDTLVDHFLRVSAPDGFVGVQAYSRFVVGRDEETARNLRRTQMGYEFLPDAIGRAVRATAAVIPGVPVLVTENGIATEDDDERVEYLDGALVALHDQIEAGVDVRGYLHWSLLDNYEWGSYRPKFGLVSVERESFERTVKPSAHHLGAIARANAIAR